MLQAVNNHITELQGKKAELQDVLELLPVQLFFGQCVWGGRGLSSVWACGCVHQAPDDSLKCINPFNRRAVLSLPHP